MGNLYQNQLKKTFKDLCINASDYDLNSFDMILLNEKNKRLKLKR